MKIKLLWVLLILAALPLLGSVIARISMFLLTSGAQGAGSVGIIGGADGPTGIFLTSTVINPWFNEIVCSAAVIILAFLIRRDKKR